MVGRVVLNKFLLCQIFIFSFASFSLLTAQTGPNDDFDGDGIINSVDIDDDNDGVLDATESPSCFYTATEAGTIAVVSTPLANDDGVNVNLPFMHDGVTTSVAASNNVITIDQAVNGTVIYNIEYSTAIRLTSISHYGTTFGTGATAKIQGSNDKVTWDELMTAATAATANPKVFTVNNSTSNSYRYYRIIKVAGTSTPAITTYEITSVQNTANYNPSAHPKPTCTDANMDGDGIPPHRDLDTDGDGCSDSVEAGNTPFTANNTTTFNTGTDANGNGLLDKFESSTTPGTINYTSTYNMYAKNASISVCTDTDGDGIADITDIDDDNDGVVDIVEQVQEICASAYPSSKRVIWQSPIGSNTATGNLTIGSESVQVTATTTKTFNSLRSQHWGFGSGTYVGCPDVSSAASSSAINIFTNNYTVTFTFSRPVKNPVVSFSSFNGTSVNFPQPVYVSGLQGTVSGVNVGSYITTIPATENIVSVTYNGVYNSISFTVPDADNQGAVMLYVKEILNTGTGTYTLTSGNILEYSDIDTDNDGIPNRLDLDSDGDGCPDAKEAILFTNPSVSTVAGDVKNGSGGAVTSTVNTANAIVPGPYGSNGFADAIQSASNPDAYMYIYTYRFVAAVASTNVCKDSDGDGISDFAEDIDADNDGIPNAVESPGCFFTEQQAQVITTPVTSDFTWNTTNTLANTYDQNTATYGQLTPASNIQNKALVTFELPLVEAAVLESVSLNVGAIAFGAGTWQLEGLTANNTWTPLSAAQAMSTVSTVYTFSNTLASNAPFHSYRIKGVSNTNVTDNARLNEITYKYKNFQSSLHTLPQGCNHDTDGDGVLNFLDRDSDGDGCPDAVEAGVSGTLIAGEIYNTGSGNVLTGKAVAQGPYGTNGLADSVETPAESGTLNYINTYSQYAVANNISLCADTDGDSINDITDIDDDNDGVLDAVESPACFYTAAEIAIPQSVTSQIPTTGTIENLYDNNTATTFAFTVTNADNAKQKTVFEIIPKYRVAANSIFLRTNAATTSIFGTYGANAYIKAQGWNGTAWVDLATYTTNPTVAANLQTFTFTNTVVYSKYRLYDDGTTGVNITAGVLQEVGLGIPVSYVPSAHPKPTCATDFDVDRIFNHLDSDSDNDGCSDAYEAGTITYSSANGGTYSSGTLDNPASTSSATATVGNNAPADYGANGFYNILEASENGNYQGTYTYANAIDASTAVCLVPCYRPAIISGTILSTTHGITSLQRAGVSNGNWPMVRKGAWTALESKTKGFVINRLTTSQVNAIPAANLVEGMMVYNIDLDCLYINTTGTAAGWKCFNSQTCPN